MSELVGRFNDPMDLLPNQDIEVAVVDTGALRLTNIGSVTAASAQFFVAGVNILDLAVELPANQGTAINGYSLVSVEGTLPDTALVTLNMDELAPGETVSLSVLPDDESPNLQVTIWTTAGPVALVALNDPSEISVQFVNVEVADGVVASGAVLRDGALERVDDFEFQTPNPLDVPTRDNWQATSDDVRDQTEISSEIEKALQNVGSTIALTDQMAALASAKFSDNEDVTSIGPSLEVTFSV